MDAISLWRNLDRKRKSLNLTWRDVGRITKVSPSLISRMHNTPAFQPGLTSTIALVEWLNDHSVGCFHQWTPAAEMANGRYRVMCQWCMAITETPPTSADRLSALPAGSQTPR